MARKVRRLIEDCIRPIRWPVDGLQLVRTSAGEQVSVYEPLVRVEAAAD